MSKYDKIDLTTAKRTTDFDVTTALSSDTAQVVERTQIELVVRNASSVAITGGKWAVKDNQTGQVAEATFGYIAPGGAQQRYLSLPSGFEYGIYKFDAQGGGDWVGIHGGNNTDAARLTLTD